MCHCGSKLKSYHSNLHCAYDSTTVRLQRCNYAAEDVIKRNIQHMVIKVDNFLVVFT
jgi:hypothetical protein